MVLDDEKTLEPVKYRHIQPVRTAVNTEKIMKIQLFTVWSCPGFNLWPRLLSPQLKSFHNELLSELEKKVELDARYLTVGISSSPARRASEQRVLEWSLRSAKA